jgi:glycosyltransferase involved in cell wall biosynthesis
MNILYITHFFLTRGGGEVVFCNLAEGMLKRGHNVDVVCQQITNIAENSELAGITVHRNKPMVEYKGELPTSMRQNMSFIINAVLKCSQIIRKKKVDIIHTNSFGPIVIGSILSKIHNIPIVATIHDVFTTSSPDNWDKWVQQNQVRRISSRIGPIFEKISLMMPIDTIHAISNSTKQDLIEFKVKSDMTVIYNGIDLASYQGLDSKKDYQNYVLYVGRLVFYKNLDVVIRAFKEVAEKLPDSKLVIVGEGPMREKWEKMVLELKLTQNVEFAGYVSQERKVELLSRCSALLLPSLFEGFGLVLLEAFAMSKPVLVADVKPFDEVVDDGIDGYILSAHDPHKWSEKIVSILLNKTMSENMGKQGRLKVENKFNIKTTLDKTELLYKHLTNLSSK